MTSKEEVKQFVKDRNEALFSLDKQRIMRFMNKYQIPISPYDLVFWGAVYKSICNITSAPPELVDKARQWLKEHNMKEDL